ncbi:Dcp2, box A domain-domain-containing protein [Microdochium bolleyi]|uniref:Dcp2, box A domain-domain-containing protein n=1 Tax=Microdochium bolleyi TaxID=196109 RepID=A0A136JBE2_9PEZI|nr:Dcp2, box A domain-domain-containing protein [Microdochium bolleyi]
MAEEQMTLEDWLDDLCVRFIVNLGQADLSDTARICFQIEEAQWFYEDFIRPLDPQLPSMTLKQFSLKIFQHCPLFAGFTAQEHQMAFERFLLYKTRVPVRGAIMLNAAMDSAVLVRGYKKGASWSFPRGKINKDEDDLDCAVREVIEETGFDLRLAGLVDRNTPVTPVEVTMKDQQVRLYVFRDVPEDTAFAPKTRKEIGAIQWYKLNDLPTYKKKKGKNADATSADRFYMVAPFMVQLRNWIKQQKKERPPQLAQDDGLTDDNIFCISHRRLLSNLQPMRIKTRQLHI